ncbi:transposase [Streptomyces sp. ID38640]|uniref:transposase n=1 Tax=Streptomyces sp. ID38640 TaxID=1265399 RepID=UPI00140ECCE7|nr:transposase [Streptomyces sp. ID38640]QIK04845.1 transposase [Streptomyces sp. ID38640]
MIRGDLTDTQWAHLESLLPRRRKPGRPPIWTGRQLIDGIRFCTRTGVPWRDVPERYGPRLKRHRAVATRYDKRAVRYEAAVLVAAINEWL